MAYRANIKHAATEIYGVTFFVSNLVSCHHVDDGAQK
jgi:hypothetical protein